MNERYEQNGARGVVWHSVEEELPSENGTYLVVGKSGTVCTAHSS